MQACRAATPNFAPMLYLQNNSDLVGQNSNQSLTHDEVLELKQQHKGPEILKALQDGSTTFAGKTEFSQEKWLKKKAKKYLQYVTARRPTSDLICQVCSLRCLLNLCLLTVAVRLQALPRCSVNSISRDSNNVYASPSNTWSCQGGT